MLPFLKFLSYTINEISTLLLKSHGCVQERLWLHNGLYRNIYLHGGA